MSTSMTSQDVIGRQKCKTICKSILSKCGIKQEFLRVSTGRCQFVSMFKCRHFRFKNYKIFLPLAKITFFVYV